MDAVLIEGVDAALAHACSLDAKAKLLRDEADQLSCGATHIRAVAMRKLIKAVSEPQALPSTQGGKEEHA